MAKNTKQTSNRIGKLAAETLHVTIEKGRRKHRARLVGECGRNPVEHTFSFDFITGKGQQL